MRCTLAVGTGDWLVLAVVTLVLVPVVLLMKRSVAEKGAHIGAE